MDWDDCVANIKENYDPTAKEVTEVDWSTVNKSDLENDTFKGKNRPFGLICPGRHCTEVNETPNAHRTCICQDINGNPVENCNPKDYLYPFSGTICLDINNVGNSAIWTLSGRNCFNQGASVYLLTCSCCCGCFANGTLIAVPTGVKKIEDFQVGDKVMTASIGAEAGGADLVWEPARVNFSFGTGDSQHPEMVYLHFGDARSMICTRDQLFLLETGKVKRGDRLVPGRDQFVAPNGDAVDLHEISLGAYQGGVHHIATQVPYNKTLQGHLLNSAGIVTGDFTLQIHADELKDQFFVEGHDQLPVVGSAAYTAAYPELTKTNVATYDAGQIANSAKPLQFFAHKHKQYDVPEAAAAYLTEEQSTDIANKLLGVTFEQFGLSTAKAKNLLRTFSGHYKGIKFLLLHGHMEVNAFAYEQHGKKFLALTQGLTRLEGMDAEGLAMILAHLINRLSKSPPTGANGWMSVAFADYSTMPVIQEVYFGPQSGDIYSNGEKQIQDVLFKNISSANDIYDEDPYHPTTATRLDALDAGGAMGFPPPGIGGPEQGGLHVIGATVSVPQFDAASFVARNISEADSQTVFTLLTDKGILDDQGTLKGSVTPKTDLSFLFSDATDPDTRTHLIETVRSILIDADHEVAVKFNMSTGNRPVHTDDFEFTPTALVDHVSKHLPDAGDVVLVKAKLEAGNYTVKVTDVLSSNGSTLSPDHDSAEITVN
jgi:hypothetical protein